MKQTILGRKLGMSQIFDHQGNAIPVTIIQAGPCTVLQVKTVQTDGYDAVQLGFGEKKEKHTTRPLLGHFGKSGTAPKRHIREARVEDAGQFRVGQVITVGLFEKGDFVDVTGTSKGKGFAGVMKRHGFSGFSTTHGTHESKRGPGSIGQSADPSRTFKGMRMPGQMGDATVTVQNMKVIDVREAQNLIMLKGPVPGSRNGLVVIRHAVKKGAPPPRLVEAREPEAAPEQEAEEAVTPEETAGTGQEEAGGEQEASQGSGEQGDETAPDEGSEDK